MIRVGAWRVLLTVLMVIVPLMVAAGGETAAGAAALSPATGQGSAYPALAMLEWTQAAQNDGLNVTYTPDSSTAGLEAYADGTADFAGSEADYSELYAGRSVDVPRGYAYAPDVAEATAVLYNAAGAANGQNPITSLRLAPMTIARIFLGLITNWDDPAISADNGGLVLPDKPITVVCRSGQSGTTALFYDYIAHTDPTDYAEWAAQNGISTGSKVLEVDGVNTPTNMACQSGSDTQANYIAANRWTIGYDEFGYAKVYNDDVASVENASGDWVLPFAQNISAALQSATVAPDTSEDLSGVYTSTNPLAYPISAYSYLVYQCAPNPAMPTCVTPYSDPGVANTMAQFMSYVACAGQTNMATFGYAPLPPNLSQLLADAAGDVTGQSPVQLTPQNCANPTFQSGDQDATTITVSTVPTGATAGQAVTYSATVSSSAGAPLGSVTFTTGSTTLCTTGPLWSGAASCTSATAPVGVDPVSATFVGYGTFAGSTGTTTLDVAPDPTAAPSGSTSSATGTSTSPNGVAAASLGGLSASATGLGSLTLATYGSDPETATPSGGTAVFDDVDVAAQSAFSSLALSFCDLGGGGSASWWNGSAWSPFSDQSFSSTTGCASAAVNGDTTPSLAQLTGTPVAAVGSPPPPPPPPPPTHCRHPSCTPRHCPTARTAGWWAPGLGDHGGGGSPRGLSDWPAGRAAHPHPQSLPAEPLLRATRRRRAPPDWPRCPSMRSAVAHG